MPHAWRTPPLLTVCKECIRYAKPGGVDFEAAEKCGLRAILASGLPGKVAPVSAGEIVFETVCDMLSERGYLV